MKEDFQPGVHPEEPEASEAPESIQTSVTVTEPEMPMLTLSADGKIVGPVPLHDVIAAYYLGRLPEDAKYRTDGEPWRPVAQLLPPLPGPPTAPTVADMVRELALVQVPVVAAMTMSWVVSSHEGLDTMLILTVAASAALSTFDSVKLRCVSPKGPQLPLVFLVHLILWPVAFPVYMAHRKKHGRASFGFLPSFAVGLLLGGAFVGHSALSSMGL